MLSPILVAVEICPLCGRTKRQFTCARCIKSGYFMQKSQASEGLPSTVHGCESFAAKQKHLELLHGLRMDAVRRLQKHMEQTVSLKSISIVSVVMQKRIETLQQILEISRLKLGNVKKDLLCAIEKRGQLRENVKLIRTRRDMEATENVEDQKVKLARLVDKLNSKQAELQELRRQHVCALVGLIFPISVRMVYPEFGTPPRATISSQVACADVVGETMLSAENELEEATRTVHVGGEWVSQNSCQSEHCIVGAGMPSSGDFAKYFEWLKTFRMEPRGPEQQSGLHEIEILGVPAALMYATQLANGLAFCLDVNLPHRIDSLHFSDLQISRRRLFLTVNHLMENVMHLCLSQGVPGRSLNPVRLLSNFQLCVTSENKGLGRSGPFEACSFALPDCPFDSDSSAEELDLDSESEGQSHEPDGWDQLMDLPMDHRDFHADSSPPLLEQRSLSASASGLVTSAAASVAALWSWKRQ